MSVVNGYRFLRVNVFSQGSYIEILMVPLEGQTEACYMAFRWFLPNFSQERAILGTQFDHRLLMNTNLIILLFIYSQN